jgi:DNA polymerase epsilon subunit 1
MMSKPLSEYGASKSTSITCARRMAEFLGEELVKDKGLNVKFIISQKPIGSTVSERALPIAIFQTEPRVMRSYIKKWCQDYSMEDFDMRSIIDWEYYKERFGNTILKIVTIPAALQNCENPFPKVPYPEWLKKKVKELNSIFKQTKITELFKTSESRNVFRPVHKERDIEDIGKARVRDFTEEEKKILEERKQKEIELEEQKAKEEEELKNPIDIEDDFNGWLK